MKQDKSSNRMITQQVHMLQQVDQKACKTDTTTLANNTTLGIDGQIQHPECIISGK